MTVNLNANPYYDDFSEDKQFYQLLFRPGFSVQARELTQLQSILRNQVAKFGNHIFKHGSLVIPGNSSYDLNVCYVKLVDTAVDVTSLEYRYVEGSVTGLKAIIRAGAVKTTTDPATLFVEYMNTGADGAKLFADGETLTLVDSAITFVTEADACGAASMANIGKGVYFINGTFATVEKQSVVISKYSATPSCHVVLKIEETIVTADDDVSLLDPSQGSYNYAAPGADRLKIDLVLDAIPLNTTLDADVVEIMRFNNGTLEMHAKNAKYNELDKNLARRTYDESGDYIVNGLKVSVAEHLRSGQNGGMFDAPVGDTDKMVVGVSEGKAYIRGFENELIYQLNIAVDKARDADSIESTTTNIIPSYGQFIYVTDLKGIPNLRTRATLTVRDMQDTDIGTLTVIAVDLFESGGSNVDTIWKLYVSDISFDIGKSVYDAHTVIFNGATSERATVVFKYNVIKSNSFSFTSTESAISGSDSLTVVRHSVASGILWATTNIATLPVVGAVITGNSSGAIAKVTSIELMGKNSNDSLLFQLPFSPIRNLKTLADVGDITYKSYYYNRANVAGGVASVSVTGMTIDPLEQGNAVFSNDTMGVVPIINGGLSSDGSVLTITGISGGAYIDIVVAVTKTGNQGAPKTKTLVVGASQTLAAAAVVTLGKADVVRVTKIMASGVDVTSKYSVDSGQRDYVYALGSIVLKRGETVPSGNLVITYDYFTHSAGDYFSIDSYQNSGLAQYYDSPLLSYVSPNTGTTHDLRNVIDFRPRVGDDGTFTGANASLSDLAQVGSRITTSIQYYVGRTDAVVMHKDGNVTVIKGDPDPIPKVPTIPKETLHLANINIPPYTFSASDAKVIKKKNRVYTMRDIGLLEDRIDKVEEYIQLSATENSVVNYDVIDAATGLSRFKSGYLVETFLNANTIADIEHPDFKVAYSSGKIIPQFEVVESSLTIATNNGQLTNGALTMPYTHEVFATQPFCSKVTNVNPFAAFNWTGMMTLTPKTDTWTDIQYNPVINTYRTETVTIQRPWNWVPPAGATVQRPQVVPVAAAVPAPAPAPTSGRQEGLIFAGAGVGGKIICTKLFELGLMDETIYRADQRFGAQLYVMDPEVMMGYHMWANKVVEWMSGNGLLATVAIKSAHIIATPWSQHMAYKMGAVEKDNMVGAALMCVGKVFSRFVFDINKSTHKVNA